MAQVLSALTHSHEFPPDNWPQTCPVAHVPPHVGAGELQHVPDELSKRQTFAQSKKPPPKKQKLVHASPEPQSLSEVQVPEEPPRKSTQTAPEPKCCTPQEPDESAQMAEPH